MTQRERENFYRNSTVIVDHGKEILSAVLENDLSNTNLTFEDFINKHLHDIYHLCYNKIPCCQCPGGRFVPANQNRILYPDQLDILLDIGGSTLSGHNPNTSRTSQYCCRPAKRSLSTTHLDITLLRCLLVNFAQNCRTNSILSQDVEDLVKCRNTLYAHAEEAKLTNSDYANHKIHVENIILRIARFCNIENEMQQKLNDASQRPLDETILMQYQNTLIHQSLNDRDIEEKVDKLQQHFTAQVERLDSHMGIIEDKVGKMDYRKRNNIQQAEACLSVHSKDETYVITEDVKQCCKILERFNALVIFAKSGGGKSKTSLQIAKIYQEKMYTPMLFLNDEVVKKRDLISFNDTHIVIVEDLFGKSNINFNEHLHRGLLDVFHSCIKSESCKTKLIITIRGDEEINRNLIEKHKIFEKDIIINLEKCRSWHCNMLILSKHMNTHGISLCECKQMEFKNLPPVVVRQCSADVLEMEDKSMRLCVSFFYEICCRQYEIQIGFPQACFLFCSNKNFTKQGMAYFRHTSQSLVEEMNNLKIEGFDKRKIQYQYCVLVYTAIKRSINLDSIDENSFRQILSSVYDDSQKIKMPLLKTAVFALQGTYMRKHSPLPVVEIKDYPNANDMYVLQHYTIQEAVFISYSEEADVLPFCDFVFLLEYIRPKGYISELSDKMVLLYTDYRPLVKRLINMLSIDDYTCIDVGVYLQVVALVHRRDEIIQFFFQNMENVEPVKYTNFINGLTSFGKNGKIVEFHPKLFRKIMIHAGLAVFCAFCRPIGWTCNDTHFVEMETNLMIKTLLKFFNRLDENSQETKMNFREYIRCFAISELGIRNGRYLVGDYVYKNLIEKGFVNVAQFFFTNLKQVTSQISPNDLKDFLDGLLYDGKRSSIVSKFKDFFEVMLFKYGSIPVVLSLCRPLTAKISKCQNIIKVEDRFLAGKISAYLESSSGITIEKMIMTFVPRENGTYFVFWDDDYFEMKFVNDIAKYISKHGFLSNNNKFVQVMYEQFVEAETSSDEESGNELTVNGNMVVFGSSWKVDFVKRVYCNLDFIDRTTYTRLFKFLDHLDDLYVLPRYEWETPDTLMGSYQIKFRSLMDDIDPERVDSVSDCSDYYDDFDDSELKF